MEEGRSEKGGREVKAVEGEVVSEVQDAQDAG